MVPVQMAPVGAAARVTVGVMGEVTEAVMILEDANVVVIQVPPLVNISTAMVAPSVSVVVVNVFEAPV